MGARSINFHFRCDASIASGTGHVRRCMKLAEIVKRMGSTNVFFHTMANTCEFVPEISQYSIFYLENFLQDLSIDKFEGVYDILVVDSYQLDARWESRQMCFDRLFVIDDLANRKHKCDYLLDQGIGKSPQNYSTLMEKRCTFLLGQEYLIYDEIYDQIRAQNPIRAENSVFVCFGGQDSWGLTFKFCKLFLELYPETNITAAIGSKSKLLDELTLLASKNPNILLEVNSQNVVKHIFNCTVAVGAGGTMAWERALGLLPSVSVALADNQVEQVERLGQIGVTIGLPPYRENILIKLVESAAELLSNKQLREKQKTSCHNLIQHQRLRRFLTAEFFQ